MLRWDQHVGQIPSTMLQEKSHTTFWRTMAAVQDRGHCLQLSLSSVHFLGVHMDLYSPIFLELLGFEMTLKCKIPQMCLPFENILPLLFSDICIISR